MRGRRRSDKGQGGRDLARDLLLAALQAQSLNIYMAGASGKKLDETYKLAWLRGLKTTYYLRTVGSSHAEKSTVKAGHMNAVSSDGGAPSMPVKVIDSAMSVSHVEPATDMKFCAIDNPDCEACQ